jgi:hypothetical protein
MTDPNRPFLWIVKDTLTNETVGEFPNFIRALAHCQILEPNADDAPCRYIMEPVRPAYVGDVRQPE